MYKGYKLESVVDMALQINMERSWEKRSLVNVAAGFLAKYAYYHKKDIAYETVGLYRIFLMRNLFKYIVNEDNDGYYHDNIKDSTTLLI